MEPHVACDEGAERTHEAQDPSFPQPGICIYTSPRR